MYRTVDNISRLPCYDFSSICLLTNHYKTKLRWSIHKNNIAFLRGTPGTLTLSIDCLCFTKRKLPVKEQIPIFNLIQANSIGVLWTEHFSAGWNIRWPPSEGSHSILAFLIFKILRRNTLVLATIVSLSPMPMVSPVTQLSTFPRQSGRSTWGTIRPVNQIKNLRNNWEKKIGKILKRWPTLSCFSGRPTHPFILSNYHIVAVEVEWKGRKAGNLKSTWIASTSTGSLILKRSKWPS